MTEKELKKLNRYQLLELLLAQTERADTLQKKVEELESKLEERELHFSELGSVGHWVKNFTAKLWNLISQGPK